MDNLKIKISTLLISISILVMMLIFRFYIDKQNQLNIKELEQIVEKEIVEKYGKN